MSAKPRKTVGVYERPPKSRRTLYLAIAIALVLVIGGLFLFSQPASAASTEALLSGASHLAESPAGHPAGMSARTRDKAFEPFFTTKDGGRTASRAAARR
jgi:hypothetical protein